MTTSGSGSVLVSPGTALRSASLRSASLRSAPGETKTLGSGAIPFNFVFMGSSFSAPYIKCRAGRRLTDLGTEGSLTSLPLRPLISPTYTVSYDPTVLNGQLFCLKCGEPGPAFKVTAPL